MPGLNVEEPYFYEAIIYGERNSARMKDYHRLDISLTYRKNSKRLKLPVEWTFAVYNAYNRQNPYYYYYNSSNADYFVSPEPGVSDKPLSMYQVSFFPVLPTVSYKIYFTEDFFKKKNNDTKRFERIKKKFNNWLYYEN